MMQKERQKIVKAWQECVYNALLWVCRRPLTRLHIPLIPLHHLIKHPVNQSIKTFISPKSSADRAQRRTDPHNDLVFRQQGGGPPRGYDGITKAMGKALVPVLVLRGTKNVLNLCSINILSISTKQVNL